MKEITFDGELATLYKTLDVDDCVAKIKHWFFHKTEFLVSAPQTAAVVRDRFSIENHIKELSCVYEEALL